MNKVNVGLRKTRRALRKAREEVGPARVRASAFGEMDGYNAAIAKVKALEEKYALCKEGVRLSC